MPTYRNTDGDSAVVSYDYGSNWIEVEFRNGSQRFYRYTYASAGSAHIEKMKILADRGDGLNAYINMHVAKKYESKR